MTNLVFTPLLPWPALAALAAAGLIVLALVVRARPRAAPWRALVLAAVLAALTDPRLVAEKRDPQSSVVAIVLDKSGSQTIGGRMRQTDEAREKLEAALAALGGFETRIVTVGDDPGNGGTQAFTALAQGLKDVSPQRLGGAILVTDGVVHDIPQNLDALGFKAPLHALITGHAGERDRRIELVEAPRFGIVGKDQTIRAKVVDTAGAGERVSIEVRRDGVRLGDVLALPGQIVDIPVKIEHGGANVVELDVPAVPGELTELDNKAVAQIEGVRDRLKVLLVSGEPHPGERAWRNLLRADANVELVHFTILRPPEKLDGVPASELSLIAFPTADLFGRKIDEFDLIIFDRYSSQTLLPSVYFQNIARFVEKGGAFLAAVGPDYAGIGGLYYSPLEPLLPARPDGDLAEQAFRAKISEDGKKHPVTRGLGGGAPWSEWFRQVDATLTKGHALLAGAKDKPLLVLSREGKGRVALLLSDQIWLWARGYEGGGPYADLTRRLAHWLMKEPDLEEEALRATAHGREATIERQSLADAFSPVTVTTPSGAQSELKLTPAEPGLARAQFSATEMGLYRFESDGFKALVNIGPENPREFREVASTPDKLRAIAQASGGTVRRLSTGGADTVTMPRIVALEDATVYGGADWLGVRRAGASTLIGVDSTPLALGPWAMAILLAAAALAWRQEGRA